MNGHNAAATRLAAQVRLPDRYSIAEAYAPYVSLRSGYDADFLVPNHSVCASHELAHVESGVEFMNTFVSQRVFLGSFRRTLARMPSLTDVAGDDLSALTERVESSFAEAIVNPAGLHASVLASVTRLAVKFGFQRLAAQQLMPEIDRRLSINAEDWCLRYVADGLRFHEAISFDPGRAPGESYHLTQVAQIAERSTDPVVAALAAIRLMVQATKRGLKRNTLDHIRGIAERNVGRAREVLTGFDAVLMEGFALRAVAMVTWARDDTGGTDEIMDGSLEAVRRAADCAASPRELAIANETLAITLATYGKTIFCRDPGAAEDYFLEAHAVDPCEGLVYLFLEEALSTVAGIDWQLRAEVLRSAVHIGPPNTEVASGRLLGYRISPVERAEIEASLGAVMPDHPLLSV